MGVLHERNRVASAMDLQVQSASMDDGESKWVNYPIDMDGGVLIFWNELLEIVRTLHSGL